jgi:hypothetical protein
MSGIRKWLKLHEIVQVAGSPTAQNGDIPPNCLGFLNQSRDINGPVGTTDVRVSER